MLKVALSQKRENVLIYFKYCKWIEMKNEENRLRFLKWIDSKHLNRSRLKLILNKFKK